MNTISYAFLHRCKESVFPAVMQRYWLETLRSLNAPVRCAFLFSLVGLMVCHVLRRRCGAP
jgi:hypothetical protein